MHAGAAVLWPDVEDLYTLMCLRAVNAETMTADAVQTLMRHKSYTTTQRYIHLARQVNRAVENLHVPEVLRRKKAR